MSVVKTGKRPLRSLTAHEKLDAIRRVHDGESKASVARDIGVPESTLRGWCKNEDKISYLSRQSSPDTDESLNDHTIPKRPRVEDQPFNLSLKSDGHHSPNAGVDLSFKPAEPDTSMKTPPSAAETPKSTSHISERERNRAELARLSVELGLNRPEMFVPNVTSASSNLTDLTANISLLAQWNTLLMQKSLRQQAKTSVTAAADTSTNISPAGGGLLTTVDKQKDMLQHLPKDKQSVHESVWYWLTTQQMRNLAQTPTSSTLPTPQTSNGISSSTPSSTNAVSSTQFANSMTPDQSSWFWKWCNQFAQGQQLSQDTKPILYQQLTKEAKVPTPPPPKQATPPAQPQSLLQTVQVPDQQNAENLSMHDEKQKQTDKSTNNKVRSVLDNLLFNNTINVAVNRKETRAEEDKLSQSEAVEHGEKFLQWLETCSDPSVTAMQIMQFRTLLNNVKSGADRKNGDLQTKTKVKRK
ncbi:unnamed protein product [Acanthoscelides obtectus]|uniref:HTH psq-type domain-containing protein n=1 Tax=Acanthoscelides obtectus TaxID=200917 RepID=A0A9P0JL06_ACAOB|nr:unnamed protein product [Acanthoscelides obtectus]CAK1658041.1 Protein distal antenna [Acanthoscelides obtectus]